MYNLIISKSRIVFVCLLVFALGCFSGCKKNMAPATFKDANATISFTGTVAADGCGYLVKINNTLYHADNLSDFFAIDKLNVVISANITTDKYQCGNLPGNLYPTIHIVAISK